MKCVVALYFYSNFEFKYINHFHLLYLPALFGKCQFYPTLPRNSSYVKQSRYYAGPTASLKATPAPAKSNFSAVRISFTLFDFINCVHLYSQDTFHNFLFHSLWQPVVNPTTQKGWALGLCSQRVAFVWGYLKRVKFIFVLTAQSRLARQIVSFFLINDNMCCARISFAQVCGKKSESAMSMSVSVPLYMGNSLEHSSEHW